ncbi:MAG: rhodanese-like domain-containing protein [Bdellovibrio sp.]|nr:rhodanese-like domain-containing protein [Bdellovibrio sp.]
MLINMGPSLAGWYSSVNKMHVENYEILTNPVSAIVDLEAKKIPKDFAIVVTCDDGKKSEALFIELQKKAYTNVYLVDGGYQQMMTERVKA